MKAADLFKMLLCFDAAIAGIILCGIIFYMTRGYISPVATGTWFFVLLLLIVIIAAVILK